MAEYRDEYVADVTQYVRDVRRGADAADDFSDKQDKAALAARKMAAAANEAGDKAARAQRKAAEAATVYERAAKEAAGAAVKLAKGEIKEAEAAKLAAQATKAKERSDDAASRAVREKERAEIKGAEAAAVAAKAARANAEAVDQQADQYRQLARDAQLAGAAQRLSSLMAGNGYKKNRSEIERLTALFPELAKAARAALQGTAADGNAMFQGIAKSGYGTMAIIAAAIASLPVLAELAGGAIAAGVGGGLIALGLMATKSDKQVRAALKQTADHVKSDAKQISAPFKQVWLDVAREGRNVWDAFSAHLKDDFEFLAPAASVFTHALGDGLVRMRPGIDALAKGFAGMLRSLSAGLPSALEAVSNGLKKIGNELQKNPQDVADLLNGIIKLGGALLGFVGYLMGVYHALREVGGAFGNFGDNLWALDRRLIAHIPLVGAQQKAELAAAKAVREHEGAVRGQSVAQAGLSAAQSAAAMRAMEAAGQFGHESQFMILASQSAKDLKTSLDALTGKELTAREAAANYGSAILAMNKALKDNGRQHGFATAKGIANEQALTSLARAAQDNAVAMRNDGKSAKDVGTFMEGARKRIIDAAIKMHYSRDEARKLADKLLGVASAAKKVPKGHNLNYNVRGNAVARLNAISYAADIATGALGRTLAASMGLATGGYVGRANGGPVPGFAAGGLAHDGAQGFPVGGVVRGPGTGTSDSIPAWLSDGEYVINAAATRMWRPVLDAINYGRAKPSAPSASTSTRSSGGGATVVNVYVAGHVTTERKLTESVRQALASRSVLTPGKNGTLAPRAA